jgi:S-DNA-T family DNA segregation ATPase FtsK/SpoIIIE
MTDTPISPLGGEVIDFPARPGTGPAAVPDGQPAPSPAPAGDGAGDGPPPSAPAVPDDPGDDAAPRVLVDDPSGPEPGKLAAAWATRAEHRRPVIPAWLRSRAELAASARWLAGYTGHIAAYHAVRLPKYGARLALRSPAGAVRVLVRTHRWVLDHEAHPLRQDAVRRNDPDTYLKLRKVGDERTRGRAFFAILAALLTAGAGLVIATTAPPLARLGALAAVVAALGWVGTPEDKPLLDTAVTVSRVHRLTSEIILRAVLALGIAEINKTAARHGEKNAVHFVAPITRDGPGWRADLDLPYGVTAIDIIERRDRLASGLRRPIGCVWPEPVHDEHAGRLVLWVGDQAMNQAKAAAWPLARHGQADLFKPIPFATDQRHRNVPLTLMYANVLIAAMPGMGKTFALRVLALAAALDPLARMLVFELKGTGDLSACEKVAHRYASGPDDDTIRACLEALRETDRELATRAKTIKGLPKDACPENKVTPALAARKNLGLWPLVLIIDECQELFTHPAYGKEAAELATAIIKRGRALGVILLLATQRPDKDSLPTGISANVGIRYCLRVMGQVENDMVLGTSAYRNGLRATMFTKNDKGIGYLVGDADDPQVARSYYIDGPAADRICDRARTARIAAGTLSGYAAGEADESAPAASILDDILAVTSADEDKVRSQVIADRLAALRPETYGPWAALDPAAKAAQVASALDPFGVATVQVNRTDAGGKRINTKGIVRADILTIRDRMRAESR